MESNINWLDLPDNIWESILNNLEDKDLLKASETCKKFNNLLSSSQQLIKKLCLQINNPYGYEHFTNETDRKELYKKSICELKFMKKCLLMSERKYESIIIDDLGFNILESHAGKKKNKEKQITNVLTDIFKYLARSVKEIKFSNVAELQNDEFCKIIQIMKNLTVLKFYGSGFGKEDPNVGTEIVRPDIVPSIHKIYIENVDGFSFKKLYLFDAITTLDVSRISWLDYESFENFLLMQKHLKVLHLNGMYHCGLFKTDILTTNIKFSLEELTLSKVYWTNSENAMKFFKTQINLKKLTLIVDCSKQIQLDELLILFFGNNLQLKTVKLCTQGYIIKNLSFLEGIVNPSVDNLELYLDWLQNGTEFIATFAKLFPNVKNFSYGQHNNINHGFDQIYNWKSLESLDCNVGFNDQIFENVYFGEKFTTCKIFYYYENCFRKPCLMEFLIRHQNIKYLSLNSQSVYHNLVIPDDMLSLIVNTLKSLETLIWNEKNCSLLKYLK